ncbi:MAG: hypothetical protein P1U56_20355 [Saprospiraceae bacterium]|nr:hypothetical protein [Saprospiraceae bacterium]
MHVIIEIAISMVGLYIIFSIVNSALVEGYAQLINKRGKFLKNSLDNFFQDPTDASVNLANDLYNNRLIQAFMEKKSVLPAYIEGKIFTTAFMELIFKDTHEVGAKFTGAPKEDAKGKLPPELEKTLRFILNKATDDSGVSMTKVQDEIQSLYESYMVRVGEWYKKKMKILLGITGILLALLLNLDSINFYTTLKNDGELRREQVMISEELNANSEQIMAKAQSLKDSLNLKGMSTAEMEQGMNDLVDQILTKESADTMKDNFSDLKIGIHQFTKGKKTIGDYLWGFLGIFITGFALSFGSTFWFSLLRRMVGKKS